ncbi:MAG: glycosyl transferase family 90, partial [Methylococcaceae bacterium]
NDVATNLKWVMSSNSVAVMPRPKYETWFMEGTLIPNVHYIEIKDDYSNLEEKINYYEQHPNELSQIVENAHNHVSQFLDSFREKIIALLVLKKYFYLTGQS